MDEFIVVYTGLNLGSTTDVSIKTSKNENESNSNNSNDKNNDDKPESPKKKRKVGSKEFSMGMWFLSIVFYFFPQTTFFPFSVYFTLLYIFVVLSYMWSLN